MEQPQERISETSAAQPCPGGCSEYHALSRRGFLGRGAGVTAAAVVAPAWVPRVGMSPNGPARDVLLNVYLRGGMDALTAVPPYGEPELYVQRPNVAVPPPGGANTALDLDGFFGLAPAAAPLLTPWSDGKLAIVHACGSPLGSRSHFDEQAFWELGIPGQPLGTETSGWLARHLQNEPPVQLTPLRAAAMERLMPRVLVEAPDTLPLGEPATFRLPGNPATEAARRSTIEAMYAGVSPPLGSAALSTFDVIDLLATINFENYQPANGAVYPETVFGRKIRNAAALIKAQVGVEAIAVDLDGWDHHDTQGPLDGVFAALMGDLALTLEAFYLDMGLGMDGVVVAVQSEFGRRLAENGSLGTDHGYGGALFVMGGHVNGGQVITNWPGLDPGVLVGGDLGITIDYRDVLGEILAVRMASSRLDLVFPNYTPTFPGVVF
ncbi:MAG TPA: DUF1501 domain-containing protein [Planctomycetota bacterium]